MQFVTWFIKKNFAVKSCMNRIIMFCLFFNSSIEAIAADSDFPLSTQVSESETELAQGFAIRESAESPFEYTLGVSYRKDNMKWSIATDDVNVASELNWNDIVAPQIRIGGIFKAEGDWLLRGYYATGAVRSGDSRDSDYAANGHAQEYSRSVSKIGGSVADYSIGVGKRWRYVEEANGAIVYLTPMVGLSMHTQNLNMRDGQKTIPFNAELVGLDNRYDTRWRGIWIGLEAIVGVKKSFAFNSRVECHWVDYFAEANWNLRSDYRHPVSFEHETNGLGWTAAVGFSYYYTMNTSVNFGLEFQKWRTNAGRERTYFSYGDTATYTLNPIDWKSKAVTLDVVYEY